MTQPTVSESTEGSSSPKDRLQSHQVHLNVSQAYTCTQYIHKKMLSYSYHCTTHMEWICTEQYMPWSGVCPQQAIELVEYIELVFDTEATLNPNRSSLGISSYQCCFRSPGTGN